MLRGTLELVDPKLRVSLAATIGALVSEGGLEPPCPVKGTSTSS
jgi:hypothetical protein